MTTDNTEMPPIPPIGERGPYVCATIRLYLAVLDDLSMKQVQLVLDHVYSCSECMEEYHLLNRATQLVASLPDAVPSTRVDQAIREAIAAKNASIPGQASRPQIVRVSPQRRAAGWSRSRSVASLLAAAVIVLAVLASMRLLGLPTSTAQAFALPANLSWSGYVLYHDETRMGNNGVPYDVDAYYNLSTGQMHVETKMSGHLDVIAVGDEHAMLGLDMMHHVAQWQADDWAVDDSMFDLTELRSDLRSNHAVYLGKSRFDNQDVYSIRCKNGAILLLDMQYHPVNALSSVSAGKTQPMFTTFRLLPAAQVSNDMWDMSMPHGFQMGKLPPKP